MNNYEKRESDGNVSSAVNISEFISDMKRPVKITPWTI